MIVKINIECASNYSNTIEIALVDNWYESNYWTTGGNKMLGATTGGFKYFQGKGKIVLWDKAGTDILHINNIIGFPPYHITDAPVKGQAFYNVRNKIMRFGNHMWFHRIEDTED